MWKTEASATLAFLISMKVIIMSGIYRASTITEPTCWSQRQLTLLKAVSIMSTIMIKTVVTVTTVKIIQAFLLWSLKFWYFITLMDFLNTLKINPKESKK
jgi:hypothetical protein